MSITREEIKQIIEDNTEFGYTSYKQIADRINDLINQKERLQVQVARPTDIEEVRCSKCNFSGSHLIKLSHQKNKDRIIYECLNCGNIEVVLTSTPIKDTVVEEALNLLDYIRVLMLNCKTTEKLIDYYYEPVKQHIQAQSKALQDKDNEIEKLKELVPAFTTEELVEQSTLESFYNKECDKTRKFELKFSSIEKVIEEFEELDTEYEQTDLDNIQMFISKIQQIIKEG